MPIVTTSRRRALVTQLLGSYSVPSQAALADLLAERGTRVDQSTLSRDLRDLGVIKTPEGYSLPGGTSDLHPAASASQLAAAIAQWLLSATAAQNQVVLSTPAGGAQPLCVALDAARHQSIVGTLAGDDTILIICADSGAARRLAQELGSNANPVEVQR